MTGLDLAFETYAIAALGASVIDATDIGTHAMEYGLRNWAVFPGSRSKAPAIKSPHPKGSKCKGECGRHGHGLYDATTDLAQIKTWWGGRYRGANILGRVPESMFVLDVDDLDVLAELLRKYGLLPETLTTISGRAAGGEHHYFRRPAGKLSSVRLPKGIQIKTSSGYAVLPPSIHPHTGNRYTRVDAPVASPPDWLVDLLTPASVIVPPRRRISAMFTGDSIADQYSASTSWADILIPHDWECPGADYDDDGAVWLHPTHTSNCSATVRHGCLFVYSNNTPFDYTEAGDPHGYTRFKAYAVLNHGGDQSAAARALRKAA